VRGIRERGVVVSVDENGATIRIAPASEEHCSSCGACGAAGPSGTRMLEVPGSDDLTAGTEVLVETAPVSHAFASVMLLFVPLVGLVAGAILGALLGPDLGLVGEAGPILGGLFVLVLSYVGVVALDRGIRRRRGGLHPRVVAVLDPQIGA
jgi:positive regulator of sigma E activity